MNLVETNIALENLRDLRIADKAEIENAMQVNMSADCENCFANLFMWANAYNTLILWWKDKLVAYNAYDKLLHYPVGKHSSPQELRELAESFKKAGLLKLNYIYNLPPDYDKMFGNEDNYFKIVADKADADYLYDVEKLINQTGAKLRKKRNHIKHFTTLNPDFSVEKLSASNMAQAQQFINGIDDACGLFIEELAIARGMDFFEQLNLNSIILRSNPDKIAAVAIFSKITDDVYTVHFEKSDKSIEGAAQMIVPLEAQEIKRLGGSIMNREQDLGDENLRRAKESLDPQSMYARQRAYFQL